MECPHCGRKGRRIFRSYCSKVHLDLDKKSKVLVLSCARCGDTVTRLSSQVKENAKVYCKRCPKNSAETHPRWREGQYLNPAGYRLILIKGEYKLEHRHTWEQVNHACILPEAHGRLSIHHINMIKTDNRPENLVMLTNQEHGRVHRLMDASRYEEAKRILIQACKEQAFWVLNTIHLERLSNVPLPKILNEKT